MSTSGFEKIIDKHNEDVFLMLLLVKLIKTLKFDHLHALATVLWTFVLVTFVPAPFIPVSVKWNASAYTNLLLTKVETETVLILGPNYTLIKNITKQILIRR